MADNAIHGDLELLPLKNAKGAIWTFFGFQSKDGEFVEKDKRKRDIVYCKLCFQSMKYCGNTTNLHFHLRTKHPTEYNDSAASKPSSNTNNDKATNDGKRVSNSGRAQLTIPNTIQATLPLPKSSPRYKTLTNSVCYFLARDMQPYDTVNDAGFRYMLKTLEPRYTPPDRKTIATTHIPKMYEIEKNRIKASLMNVSCFSITTDMWTSRAKHAYTALTVHYLNADFQLCCHMLETKEFQVEHTGMQIASELRDILQSWDLPEDKLIAATTDNGSNIVCGLEHLGWNNIRCFAHTLQLAVLKAVGVPDVSRALARCRNLVSHFNRSAKSTNLLKKKQTDLKHKSLCLIQEVATRWNSSYYMAERILNQQQPICATLMELRKGELMPTDAEFKTLECFVEVMKPFVDITEALGAENWVTISSLAPLLYKILNICLKISSTDNRVVVAMKEAMYNDLSNRYHGTQRIILNKSALLDPRFKSLPFLKPEEKNDIAAAIVEEIVDLTLGIQSTDGDALIQSIDLDADTSCSAPKPKRSRGEHVLLTILSDVFAPSSEDEVTDNNSDSPRVQANLEIKAYLKEEPTEEAPLEWWKRNAFRYPLLSNIARRYLIIPATSVPSERVFSTAGHIANQKRACLLPENVTMLVFLAENLQ